jgi:hypothetical protein
LIGSASIEVEFDFIIPMLWCGRYDSARAMHGAWAGVKGTFREFCVHDPAAVRVIKVEGFVAAPT